MTCGHCGATNEPDDHRCERCGRRLGATAPEVMGFYRTDGNRALAVEFRTDRRSEPEPPKTRTTIRQAELFSGSRRVVAIDGSPVGAARAKAQVSDSRPSDAASVAGLHEMQQSLDFTPVRKAIQTTTSIRHGKAPVAEPMRRLIAGAADFALCGIAVLVVAILLWSTIGHGFLGEYVMHFYLGVAAVVAASYKLLFVAAEMDSPGLRWCGLRLLNFDGQIPGRGERAKRFLWALISTLPGGLGLVWSFAEADRMTWHDISTNTYLSPVPQRR